MQSVENRSTIRTRRGRDKVRMKISRLKVKRKSRQGPGRKRVRQSTRVKLGLVWASTHGIWGGFSLKMLRLFKNNIVFLSKWSKIWLCCNENLEKLISLGDESKIWLKSNENWQINFLDCESAKFFALRLSPSVWLKSLSRGNMRQRNVCRRKTIIIETRDPADFGRVSRMI